MACDNPKKKEGRECAAAEEALAAVAAHLQTSLGEDVLGTDAFVEPASAVALVRDCLALLAPVAASAPARVLTEAGRLLLAAHHHAPEAPLSALAPPAVLAPLTAAAPGVRPSVTACARALLERAGDLGSGDAWVLLCDLPPSDDDDDGKDGVVTVDMAAEDARVEALLARGAACGSAAAMLALAERRYYGLGGRADAAEAVRTWTALAARGEPAALLRLGTALETGVPGVLAADPERGHACVARAAAAGVPGAARRLGEQLLDGCGCAVAVLRGAALLRGCAECRARDPVLLDRLAGLEHGGIALADASSALAILAHPVPVLEPLVLACLRALTEVLDGDCYTEGASLAQWRVHVPGAIARQCAPGQAHCASAVLLMTRVFDGVRGGGEEDDDEETRQEWVDGKCALVRVALETLARDEESEGKGAWLVPNAHELLKEWIAKQPKDQEK